MKRIEIGVLIILLAFLLCACKTSHPDSTSKDGEKNPSTENYIEAENHAQEETTGNKKDKESTNNNKEKSSKVETGKSAEVSAGQYTGGQDIPVGTYILTRLDEKADSGIVWLSAPEDDLEEEYPSLLYEYVGKGDDISFFISLQEGGILSLPFECKLTSVNYSKLKTGDSVYASAGVYTGGLDLPSGQYVLSYSSEHAGSGILWLSSATDDLTAEYPSKIYEYISKGIEGKWFISLEDGGKLSVPFPCDSIERINPYNTEKGQCELYAGYYVIGSDIPAGKYKITCKTNNESSGIVWVSSPEDNLDEEYPSILYEYIGKNSEETFYVSVDDGGRIYLPCEAILSPGSVVFH